MRKVLMVAVLLVALAAAGCGADGERTLYDANPRAAAVVLNLRVAAAAFADDPAGEAEHLAAACASTPRTRTAIGISAPALSLLLCGLLHYELAAETALYRAPDNTLDIQASILHGNEALDDFVRAVVEGW